MDSDELLWLATLGATLPYLATAAVEWVGKLTRHHRGARAPCCDGDAAGK